MLVIWLKKQTITEITEIENKFNNHNHDKYIDTWELNRLAADVSNARLAQANLIIKTDFDAKLSSLNKKITSSKAKRLLIENELNKLKTFDSSYFISKSHFGIITQNYLVFQPIIRYFKVNMIITVADYVLSWKSKGLSAETTKPPTTSDNRLTPLLLCFQNKSKIYWKLFKTIKNFIHSWKSSKHLHCLWTWCI